VAKNFKSFLDMFYLINFLSTGLGWYKLWYSWGCWFFCPILCQPCWLC